MKGELTNETIHHDTEIEAYQFEPELWVIKKVNPGEGTGWARVFKESGK